MTEGAAGSQAPEVVLTQSSEIPGPRQGPFFELVACLPQEDVARWDEALFWTKLRAQVREGCFWADEIKKIREHPDERLALALEHLPLPGAFREAGMGIALRAQIAAARKSGTSIESTLRQLYILAALESFYFQDGYIPEAECPEFNVIAMFTGADYREMSVDYTQLGYRKLPLGVQAQKLLAETWGEPKGHRTLRELYPEIWKRGVDRLVVLRASNRWKELKALLHQTSVQSAGS